jgi:hypothetical protein
MIFLMLIQNKYINCTKKSGGVKIAQSKTLCVVREALNCIGTLDNDEKLIGFTRVISGLV